MHPSTPHTPHSQQGAVRHTDAKLRVKSQSHAKRRGLSASEARVEAKIRQMKAAARNADKIG